MARVITSRCYAAIYSLWITNLINGITLGYPSTALPDIASGRYGFVFPSSAVAAWYVSCNPIITVVGQTFASRLVDNYGRKFGLVCMLAFQTIGWLCTSEAKSVAAMFVGRVLISLTDGAQQSMVFVFAAELMPKEIRGMVSFGNSASYLSGVTLSYVIGTFINWRWHAVVVMGMALVSLISVILFLPETPRWLIMSGEREIAKQNLKKVRHFFWNADEKIENELREIEASEGIKESTSCLVILRRLLKPPFLKPFILVNISFIFQQLSGTAYIKSFTVKIFEMSSGSRLTDKSKSFMSNSHYQTIIVGLSGILGSLLSIPASDRFGRRPCLITSASIVTLSLTATAAYFWMFYFYESWTLLTIGWLPLLGLVCFNVGYGIGYCPGPGTLSCELMPTSCRATVMPIFGFTHSLGYFIVIQVFGGFGIEPRIIFTTLACIAVIGIIFLAIFIPETKNKSVESIEKIWKVEMMASDEFPKNTPVCS